MISNAKMKENQFNRKIKYILGISVLTIYLRQQNQMTTKYYDNPG